MSERPDLRDLVGEEVTGEELAALRRVDELLRSVPPPPAEVPASLTHAVRAATPTPFWTRRRVAVAVALAAALSALSLGLGVWLDGTSNFDARETVRLQATGNANGASGLIRLGPADEHGNWTFELVTRGLPRLPAGAYYVLWLAKDGEYAGTCGTFRAGAAEATIRMNASYELRRYDRWVVSAVDPARPEAEEPWLLQAPIDRA